VDEMTGIKLDLHLYGTLARHASSETPGYAHLDVSLPENSTMGDLLVHLGIPTEERGITFVNGNLSALPGLQPDLEHVLHNNDRVAFFDLKSMWPFQYRHGVVMTDELSQKLGADECQGMHHSYDRQS
jgi:hypothetical protein